MQELQAIGKEIIGTIGLDNARMSETAAAAGVTNNPYQAPTSLPFVGSNVPPSTVDANESAQLWLSMNQQLDINTWITDNFPAQ